MIRYKIRLLSPLYYNSRPESGAAGGSVTSQWIGDLALMYAINSSLGIRKFEFKYNSHRPDYSELTGLDFICSVARSERQVRLTPPRYVATSFVSEGYPLLRAMKKSANSPFRNWLVKQGLEPNNEFYFYMGTRNGFEPPEEFTVRLGNMRACIASCIRAGEKENETLTVNMFTLKLFKSNNLGDMEGKITEVVSPSYVFARVGQDEWSDCIHSIGFA